MRLVGAGPRTVVGLRVGETDLITAGGSVLGAIGLYANFWLVRDPVDAAYGLCIAIQLPSLRDVYTLQGFVAGGVFAGLLPTLRAYRYSLANSMLVRI